MKRLILGIFNSRYSGQFQISGSALLPAIEPNQEMTVSTESIVAVPVTAKKRNFLDAILADKNSRSSYQERNLH
jgi:hypothetical protein